MTLDHHLLRKCQRQLKADRFAALAAGRPRLRLALARIQGPAAMQACANDAQMPAEDRELAAWSQGDLKSGLLALRRRTGCQEVAEGWLLLLKGDAERALASFERAASTQPRRAACGQAVALAAFGRLDQAAVRWAACGPIPGGVFPAAGRLARQLTRHEAGWDAAALSRLVASGTRAEVEQALRACPADRVAEGAWLALRLADLLAQADPGDQRQPSLWDRAYRHPPLRADVLKRRMRYKLRQGDPEDNIHELAELHALLAATDAAEARICVEAVISDLPAAALGQLHNPALDPRSMRPRHDAPVEWVLLWLRQASVLLGSLRSDIGFLARGLSRASGVPLPPESLKGWRPWLRLLDQEYATDPGYIEAKLALLAHFKQKAELRLALYQLLLAQPERGDELLPRWTGAAIGDLRSRKRVADELAELQRRFPGTIILAFAHMAIHPQDSGAAARLAEAMPPVRAGVWRWINDIGPEPEGPTGDEAGDLSLFIHIAARRLESSARRWIDLHPGRLHQICLRSYDGYHEKLGWWIDQWTLGPDGQDWRGWYHRGRLAEREQDHDGAHEALRTAWERMDHACPEASEVRVLLDRLEEADAPDFDDIEDEPTYWESFEAAGAIGSLELARLDDSVIAIEEGEPLTSIPTAKRDALRQLIAFSLPFLNGKDRRLHREALQHLDRQLAATT